MPDFKIVRWIGGAFAAALLLGPVATRATDLEQAFRSPPAAARPWVFWYWMQGAVSREGITADLAAMRQAGVAGAYLMPVNGPAVPPLFAPAVRQLTPEWWAMVKFAASEADRLGLRLGFDVCDGFATAGGPWITPELAMQKVVWSETIVETGEPFPTVLPQPPTAENTYRDIALLAFPTPEGSALAPLPKVTTSQPGVDAQFLATGDTGKPFRSDRPCWIQYEYAQPFTLRSLVIKQWDKNYAGVYHATRLQLEASDDGRTFRPIGRLQPPRHGWQDWDADTTFTIAPATARYFRFSHDPTGAEPGAEDLDGAKWKPRLVLRGLLLSSAPRLPGFEGKSGAVWRRSPPATATDLPDRLCVPAGSIVDLTPPPGVTEPVEWPKPPGRWTILRIGYTPTGHRNETGGGGRGLECDKFNPAAVRAQFDGWFGEAVRQLGPELAGRVLKVFHVDSWEAGSQNWTPAFRAEFTRRRGYDPVRFLPAFAGIPVDSADATERFLADVRQTISDLTAENFFGVLAERARANGCEFSAESTAPTMTGDGLRHHGLVDVPMGEFWLRSPTHDKPNDIHDAISGAHIYGKPVVQAEAFTELRIQWDEHPAMLKALADHEFALGVNRLVFHVFTHNPWPERRPGLTLNGVGLPFQRNQTWWPDAGPWIEYVSRCSALLQAGRPVADVAYFTGEDLPSRALLPERRVPALPPGYAADSINPDALLRLARAEHGRLVLPGGASYAALVMPAGPVSPAVQARIDRLEQGGVIVTSADLAVALAAKRIDPDLISTDSGLEWTHRATPDADIYFVSNQQDAARTVEVSLRATGRQAEIWQPVTGEMSVADTHAGDVDDWRRGHQPREARAARPSTRGADGPASNQTRAEPRTVVSFRMDPHGSVFVLLRAGHRAGSVDPAANVLPASRAGGISDPALQPGAATAAQTLSGPWRVTFDPTFGGPAEPVEFPSLTDWTTRPEPGIRYYSGAAVYRQTFDWTGGAGRVWLDLGQVHALARVTVNGVDRGVAWTPPYRVEITPALRRGINSLELRVTNTWNNRLLGDREAPPAAGPVAWTTAPLRDGATLLPAGLLGPVRLIRMQ